MIQLPAHSQGKLRDLFSRISARHQLVFLCTEIPHFVPMSGSVMFQTCLSHVIHTSIQDSRCVSMAQYRTF